MTRYDHWKLDSGRDDDDDERPAGCICTMSRVHATGIEPPHGVVSEWCPVHGRDPDEEMERRRDDARDIEPDCADDYRDEEPGE